MRLAGLPALQRLGSWLWAEKGSSNLGHMVLPLYCYYCAHCWLAITPASGLRLRGEGNSGTHAMASLLLLSISEVSHFLFFQPYAGLVSHSCWL